PRLPAALHILLRAWDYAEGCQRDPRDFAVHIGDLLALGLTTNDLSYLLHEGYTHAATESTGSTDNRRAFFRSNGCTIAEKSAFVLTSAGAQAARLLVPETVVVRSEAPPYDNDLRKLWFR